MIWNTGRASCCCSEEKIFGPAATAAGSSQQLLGPEGKILKKEVEKRGNEGRFWSVNMTNSRSKLNLHLGMKAGEFWEGEFSSGSILKYTMDDFICGCQHWTGSQLCIPVPTIRKMTCTKRKLQKGPNQIKFYLYSPKSQSHASVPCWKKNSIDQHDFHADLCWLVLIWCWFKVPLISLAGDVADEAGHQHTPLPSHAKDVTCTEQNNKISSQIPLAKYLIQITI